MSYDSRVVLADSFKATLNVKHGVAAMRVNRFEDAVAYFDRALELEPDDALTHWNKATSLLSLGYYVEGFKEFEWRWQMYDWRWGLLGEDIYRVRELPQWRGESLIGRRLLFYWEMGFGDGIQQLRYVRLLRNLGAKVTALMVRPLARLARNLDIEVTDRVPANLSVFDFRCSLFGVMAATAQSVESIPRDPYLHAEFCPSGKIGIAWAGRTQKDFDLFQFLSHLSVGGYQVQSLLPGKVTASVLPLVSYDFLDTLRVIECMDHVVTVDTAVAHLAGAMGHPSTHVLIPYNCDWRWNYGNAWYPKTRFYRQKQPGDWAEVFSTLNGVLRCSSSPRST